MSKTAQLSGGDGNIFFIIGRVNGFLKQAIRDGDFTDEQLSTFNKDIQKTKSYEAALNMCMDVLEEAGFQVA